MQNPEFHVGLAQIRDFQFRVHFPATDAPDLTVDEPSPLGKGLGPNPAPLLAAAVANCLAASLLFCVRKARLEIGSIEADARGTLVKNAGGRWRIGSLAVTLKLAETLKTVPALEQCLEQFEDFCIVTQSVRNGIPVAVSVVGRDGETLSANTPHTQPVPASYYIATTLDAAFDAVVLRVIQGLSAERFGVLTDIDVQATLKAKIDADMPRYRILGACNPRFAHEAPPSPDRHYLRRASGAVGCNQLRQPRPRFPPSVRRSSVRVRRRHGDVAQLAEWPLRLIAVFTGRWYGLAI